MNQIEELTYLEKIIRKYNLPMSPVLEYAIRECKEQYAHRTNIIVNAREDEIVFETHKEFEDYEKEFSHLSVGVINGKKMPHKPILLLSIMKLIEDGTITDNKIKLDKIIANAFSLCWKKYYGDTKAPSIWIPFWYLKSETFWHFRSNGNEELLQGLLQFAGHPSVGQMRPVIKYAYLDKKLYDYIENEEYREKLKEILITNYIKDW